MATRATAAARSQRDGTVPIGPGHSTASPGGRRPASPEARAEHLVSRYADLILRVSFTYLRSTHDAEDICQEVLLKLIRRDRPFESAEHERAWVIRVTANACRDRIRSDARHQVVNIDGVPEPEAPDAPSASEILRRDTRVLDAVMRLPLRYRQAIYLHYYENYPIREIARTLDASEAACAQLLSRGRAMLRTMLEGDDHELDLR